MRACLDLCVGWRVRPADAYHVHLHQIDRLSIETLCGVTTRVDDTFRVAAPWRGSKLRDDGRILRLSAKIAFRVTA